VDDSDVLVFFTVTSADKNHPLLKMYSQEFRKQLEAKSNSAIIPLDHNSRISGLVICTASKNSGGSYP